MNPPRWIVCFRTIPSSNSNIPSRWLSISWGWPWGWLAYIFGAILSALAGFIGMRIATAANARTAEAARTGLSPALNIAFRGGAITGLLVVGLSLMVALPTAIPAYSDAAISRVLSQQDFQDTAVTVDVAAKPAAALPPAEVISGPEASAFLEAYDVPGAPGSLVADAAAAVTAADAYWDELLAGIRAGARQAEVTVNGIGERAGNTSLEEIVMALRTRQPVYNLATGIDTTQITRTSRWAITTSTLEATR